MTSAPMRLTKRFSPFFSILISIDLKMAGPPYRIQLMIYHLKKKKKNWYRGGKREEMEIKRRSLITNRLNLLVGRQQQTAKEFLFPKEVAQYGASV